MKTRLVFILLLFSFLNFSISLNAKIENKIILKVNNKIITNFEVKNKIISTLILSNEEITQENINKIKGQTLEFLIQLKLKEIELDKFNYKSDLKQVNDYLNSISNNNIEGLKDVFTNNNIDFELFLENIETEFKWQKFIYSRYAKKIEIDENSVNEEINQIISKKTKIKEYNISEIEIMVNNNKSDEQIISDLKKRILSEGFEKTAFNYSISSTSEKNGNLGWIKSNALSKNIYKIISNLEIGQISKPIINNNTALIFKLNDVRVVDGDKINKINLENRIINRKSNELFNLYSKSHLSKLKNSVFIEYK